MIEISIERLFNGVVEAVVVENGDIIVGVAELFSSEDMIQQAEEFEQAANALRYYAEKMEEKE